MSATPSRVLIVTGDDTALFALHEYLSFLGSLVDTTADLDDARALVRHMHYDAVVAAGMPSQAQGLRELAHDLHSRHVGGRLVIVAESDETESPAIAAGDVVVRRALPISQLARQVRHAIRAPARSA